MKRKERFLAALGMRQPDRVPMFDFLFQPALYEALIGHRPDTYNARDVVACALALDHDAVWLRLSSPGGWQPTVLNEDTYVDEWGTTFQRTDASWPFDSPIEYPIRTRDDLTRYRWPDPSRPERVADIKGFWSTRHDDLALTAGITGPFTKAWFLMGYEAIGYALYDDPAMLEEIFQRSVAYFKECARQCVAAGAHAVWIAEDLGDSTRGFMNLDHFHRHYWP